MKRILICLIVLLTISISSLFATNEIMIYNKTGFDIYEIYISPERNTDNWSLNKIPFDVIGNDSYISLDMSEYSDFSEVDIKLVDKDGAVYYKVGILQNENQKLEVTMEDHSYLLLDKVNWNVTFINGGNYAIERITISPVAVTNEFISVVKNDEVLAPGEEFIVLLEQLEANKNYDIRFVFGDGKSYLKSNVYLSDGAYIILK